MRGKVIVVITRTKALTEKWEMIALSLKLLITGTQVLCWQSKGACGHEQPDEQRPLCPASIPKCLTSHQKAAFGLQASVVLAPPGQLLVEAVLSV